MRIYDVKDYDALSRKAASIIAAQVTLKPESVLGLATGSSPIGTYQQLIRQYEDGFLDFSTVSSVNLDEYKGLPRDNEQSYYHFMQHNLFRHININPDHTHVPNGMENDAAKECSAYEDLISRLGGIDLQLLGLGHNGHIGFNEPAEHFEKATHCVDLQESTIEANKRFFDSIDEVPKQAYTMGCGTIMKAHKILLIVSGSEKADILAQVVSGPITPQVPASLLQLHRDVTIVADKEALSKISL